MQMRILLWIFRWVCLVVLVCLAIAVLRIGLTPLREFHGWKALGARAGYSVLNGVFATLICLTGTLSYVAWAVPVDAGMAIVLWIGIVITARSERSLVEERLGRYLEAEEIKEKKAEKGTPVSDWMNRRGSSR